MPYKFRRISKKKRRRILSCFAEDVNATQAAHLTGLNRNTVNDWYNTFRATILAYQESNTPNFQSLADDTPSDSLNNILAPSLSLWRYFIPEQVSLDRDAKQILWRGRSLRRSAGSWSRIS